jgi:predicted metal-dependent hydrolase
MLKKIKLHNRDITYELKFDKRARHIRLSVLAGGLCVVTCPQYIPQIIIDHFLKSKEDWLVEKMEYLSRFEAVIKKTKKEKHDEYIKYKEKAFQIAKNRLGHYNTFYHFEWNKISIKNQKTRWGSCSKKGNLNFNYKIALLPEKSADYIIVHELCHLKEMNHSGKFWSLVAKTIPDYSVIRRNLRKDNLKLN